MGHPFCMHFLRLSMKYMHEKSVVYYSSVYGIKRLYFFNKFLFQQKNALI